VSPEVRKYHWHRMGHLKDPGLSVLMNTNLFAYLSDEGGKYAVDGWEMASEMKVEMVAEAKSDHSQVPTSRGGHC
jgi:hypothetical protein